MTGLGDEIGEGVERRKWKMGNGEWEIENRMIREPRVENGELSILDSRLSIVQTCERFNVQTSLLTSDLGGVGRRER